MLSIMKPDGRFTWAPAEMAICEREESATGVDFVGDCDFRYSNVLAMLTGG